MADILMSGGGGVSLDSTPMPIRAASSNGDVEMTGQDMDQSMNESTTNDTASAVPKAQHLPVTVTKPIPYTFDLGNLLAIDANPLPESPGPSETTLRSVARDAAQALLNQLLTTCPIKSTPAGVQLTLPPPTTPRPREKPLPVAKAQSKWAQFAAKKGIKTKEKNGKMVYDEEKGTWVPKWGYKGKNKEGEGDWLVEVDEKKEEQKGEARNERTEKRAQRKERAKRNERKMRANEKRARRRAEVER